MVEIKYILQEDDLPVNEYYDYPVDEYYDYMLQIKALFGWCNDDGNVIEIIIIVVVVVVLVMVVVVGMVVFI